MKKNLNLYKKYFRLYLWALLMVAGYWLMVTPFVFAERIELIYDGNLVQKTQVVEFGGIEYLPLKSAAILFKGKTQWYPVGGKVVLQVKNRKITFYTNSRSVSIGKKKFQLDGPPHLVKGTVFVPIDFFLNPTFAEIVECKVRWDSSAQILSAEPYVTLFPPRIYRRAQLVRVVIESKEETSPEIKRKDQTITIDIPKVRIGNEEILYFKNSPIKTVKTAHARKGANFKIVLTPSVTAYHWHQEKDPPRIVLEIPDPSVSKIALKDVNAPQPAIKDESASATPPIENKEKGIPESALTESTTIQQLIISTVPSTIVTTAPLAIPAETPKTQWIKRIVVDAGHGGKDAGALGRTGTKEKDINLLIALELARVLSVEGRYEVLLTRSSDVFVSLLDRTLFANEQKADLFVSIHCNASLKKSQRGFEIYFLSDEATDDHAEAAAELENSVIQLEEPHSPKKQKLEELLHSMARTEFINESALLCKTIATAVEDRSLIGNRGVKQADFHVLHGAQMPSVLVENAFITNQTEEQKLRQRRFRSDMVDAILTGIQNYEKQLNVLHKAITKLHGNKPF